MDQLKRTDNVDMHEISLCNQTTVTHDVMSKLVLLTQKQTEFDPRGVSIKERLPFGWTPFHRASFLVYDMTLCVMTGSAI